MACLAPAVLSWQAVAAPVQAGDHRAFWLWAGVHPQAALAQAERIYLLQGEVVSSPFIHMEARRPAPPRLVGPNLWLVIRTETLDWSPQVYGQILRAIEDWRAGGNTVEGVEIDFDARTRGLAGYSLFLRGLRLRLPTDMRLGITGLLDWGRNGNRLELDDLAGTVDEVVVQIYQGRHVIPGYPAYLAQLHRLHVPFRIGLLQGGDWEQPPALTTEPFYRGTVVFLRNDAVRR